MPAKSMLIGPNKVQDEEAKRINDQFTSARSELEKHNNEDRMKS
jgi:hypothetical protein